MMRLPIHLRIEVDADDVAATTRLVRCPDDARWVCASACGACPKHLLSRDASVTCNAGGREARWPDEAPIAEAFDPSVVCLRAGMSAGRASARMRAHGAAVAVVLDPERHPIGMVSRLDAATADAELTVGACMTPFVITLLDGTTVSDAIEAVVERGLSHVPVLADGRIVGIVTARALAACLARKLETLRHARARPRG